MNDNFELNGLTKRTNDAMTSFFKKKTIDFIRLANAIEPGNMIKEYAIIKALHDLTDKVLTGCRGTVLIIYPGFPTDYEVEFVDEMNQTVDVLTVHADDVTIDDTYTA